MAIKSLKKAPGDLLFAPDDSFDDQYGVGLGLAPLNTSTTLTASSSALAPLAPLADPFCPRQISFTILGTVPVQVTATENGGSIDFEVHVINAPNLTGDLRGIFFQFNDAKLGTLQVTGGDGLITGIQIKDDSVIDLGAGNNMIGATSPFDVGISFGTAGIGKGDDINFPVHFTISDAAHDLTLDDLEHLQFGARVTSMGDPAKPQSRKDSEKILANAPAAPDAHDDFFSIYEDGTHSPSNTSHSVIFNVLANDTDDDGFPLTITDVHQDAVHHGTVTISADGKSIIYTPDLDYAGLNLDPTSVDDSFQYCVSDGHGGEDHATVNVHIVPVADQPNISVQVLDPLPGDPVGEVRLHITASTTDIDGSEQLIALNFGSLPSGVTLTPGSLSHFLIDGRDAVTEDVQLLLPSDRTTNFDFAMTAVSDENGNGDPDQTSNTATKHIELDFNHNAATENFAETHQSIWSPDFPPGFDDNRFIGFDDGGDPSFDFVASVLPPIFVSGDVDWHLKTGFQSILHVDLGQIDSHIPIDIGIDTAYNKTTDTLLITPSFALGSGASFTTTGPEGFYKLDFIFNLLFHPDISIDGIDLPNLLDINTSNTLNLIDLSSNSPDLPFTVPLPLGLSLSFDWPHISTMSTTAGPDFISGDGSSNNFLQLTLDVDQLAAQLIPLYAPFSNPDDANGFEWLDLKLNGGLNFLQTFILKELGFDPTLTTIGFENGTSQAFDFNTPLLIHNASTLDPDHNGIDFNLHLVPNVSLHNETDLGVNVGYDFSLLKNIPIIDDTLFHSSGTLPVGSFEVYDRTFALGGYNTQDYHFVA